MTVSYERVDESAVRQILSEEAPVAVVYAGPAPEVASEYQLEWATRWRPIADELRRGGADDETLSTLEGTVRSLASARAAHGSTEVAAYASEGRLLAVFPTPGATWVDSGRVSAPAHVLPLLEWIQRRPAYVVVVTDRTGAEIESFAGAASPGVVRTVRGPDDEIERNAPGGFLAQGRYQRRAEDSWRHNAAEVARHTAAAVYQVNARLLVVSGDVRAVQLLLEKLPERARRAVTIEHVKGSRAPDGSQRGRPEVVAGHVHAAADRQLEELLHVFREERAPGGLSVESEDATLTALAEGRVGTLLVSHPRIDDPRLAWFGSTATEVLPGTRPRPVWSAARRGPLIDVAVRSALLGGGHVRVVPADAGVPAEGLGGLCRFH